MLVYVVMHGSQLLLLEAAYRYTYTRVTLTAPTSTFQKNNFFFEKKRAFLIGETDIK
jgi:hypothetical protein